MTTTTTTTVRVGCFTHRIDPAHRFALDYLVDNGRLCDWLTDHVEDCVLVEWQGEEEEYSVLGPDNKPLGYGETPDEAMADARCGCTERRRKADGVIAARVC